MASRREYDCKLAHHSTVKRLSGFNSIKELYEKISIAFSVPINEILYCTLNSHNFTDMASLLGTYLSSSDLIVVHMTGKSQEHIIKKAHEFLGLTITDNAHGRAFIKKVKADAAMNKAIKPGTHIAAINEESTIGLRHHEVARRLRCIPIGAEFKLKLIEPLGCEEIINQYERNAILNTRSVRHHQDTADYLPNISHLTLQESGDETPDTDLHIDSIQTYDEDELIFSSLPIDRLLSRGSDSNTSDNSNLSDKYRKIIDGINTILESFLGINDNALAIQIYRLAIENKSSFEGFSEAIKTSKLKVFEFGHEIETILWECAQGSID